MQNRIFWYGNILQMLVKIFANIICKYLDPLNQAHPLLSSANVAYKVNHSGIQIVNQTGVILKLTSNIEMIPNNYCNKEKYARK